MKYRYASRLLMALLVATATVAHADFVVERVAAPAADSRKAQPAIEQAKSASSIKADLVATVGDTPLSVDMAKGMGRDLTIGEALNQFIPDSYSINAADCAYRGRINWRGGKPWPEVLSAALGATGCSAVINWDDRSVTVKKIDISKPATIAKQWKVLKADKYLSVTLDRWAKENGWQGVAWQVTSGRDFPIEFEASFNGTFEEALNELMRSTQKSDLPLQARLQPNRIVRVVPYGREGGEAKK